MPPLSELPGSIDRKKLINCLVRLGFELNVKGGDGSHYKITWPKTQKCIIIPKNIERYTLKYLLEEIENYSGITWEEIKKEL